MCVCVCVCVCVCAISLLFCYSNHNNSQVWFRTVILFVPTLPISDRSIPSIMIQDGMAKMIKVMVVAGGCGGDFSCVCNFFVSRCKTVQKRERKREREIETHTYTRQQLKLHFLLVLICINCTKLVINHILSPFVSCVLACFSCSFFHGVAIQKMNFYHLNANLNAFFDKNMKPS